MKVVVSCLVVALLGMPPATSAQASPEREASTLSVRPRVGFVPAGWSYGGAVLARLARYVGVTVAGSAWSFDTACPDVIPSTCGDDGRSLTAGVRLDLTRTRSWSPFVEAQAGQYRFSEQARDGDGTLALGFRGGVFWIVGPRVELEAAIEFQRLSGYEKDGVPFPATEIGALQIGVGIALLNQNPVARRTPGLE